MGGGRRRMRAAGAFAVLAFLVMCVGGVSSAGAATTTVTLKVNQQYDETGKSAAGPFKLTLYLTPQGTTSYVVTGKVSGTVDSTPYLGGTALVVGTNLICNLTITENNTTDKKRMGGVMQVTVNKTTYKGTYWWVGSRFNQSTLEFKDKYSYGTVSK